MLLLAICVQAAEFINGDFESKPIGYPLVSWKLLKGEITSVDLDRRVMRSGRQALSISHQINSHTQVTQEFEVKINTNYLVTLWVKSDNVVASSGDTAGSCFIQDSSGSILAASPSITGTKDWEEIMIFFTSKSEKVRICLDLNMATGRLWFDDIAVKEYMLRSKENISKSGFPIKVRANYFAQTIYTQQLGLKTLDIIQVNSSANPAFSNIYLNYSLIFAHQSDLPLNYYLWDGAPVTKPGTGFENTQPNRSWTPYMTTFRIGVRENFNFFSEPVSVEFGTLNVLWSPYIAYFEGTQQGIGIKNIKWNKFAVDGFWVWDPYVKLPAQPISYRTGGSGLQIQKAEGNLISKLIFVQHYDANLNPELKKVTNFGDYPKDEQTLFLEVGYNFRNGYQIKSTNVVQKKYTWQAESEKVNAVYRVSKMDFVIHLKGLNVSLSYRAFDPGFAPRYRSYVPKYDHDKEVLNQWNPVTEFANQKGFRTEISGPLLGKTTKITLDHYRPHPSVDYRNNLAIYLKGKTSFDMLVSYDQGKDKPIRYMEIAIDRQLLQQRFGSIDGEVKFIQDNWYACPFAGRDNFYNAIPMGPNHNLSPSAKEGLNANIIDLNLIVKLRRYLPGLNFTAGVQSASDRYHFYLNGELQLIKLLNIRLGYRTNDRGYGGDSAYGYWYDDYYRRHYPGTFLHCRTSFSF